MKRRGFIKSIGMAVFGLLVFKLPVKAVEVPDFAVGASLRTRIHDYLFYRPWTDAEIAERVARSVANTHYRAWHNLDYHVRIPIIVVRPGGHSWFREGTDD